MRVLLVSLLFVPAALGGAVPELLYLAPGITPFEGSMSAEAPQSLNGSYGVVLPGTADTAALQFSYAGNQSQMLGPLLLGLWTGPSPTLVGNITAVLKEGEEVLADASVDIALDPEGIDPLQLIPPDPTDPEAAAAYVAAQAAAMLMSPPVLLDLGFIDQNLTGEGLSLSFFLEGEPIALGAATIQYGGALAPSFLYLPFYEPDPPAPEPTSSSSSSSSASDSSSSSMPASGGSLPAKDDNGMLSEPESEESPAFAVPLVLAALALVAYRRKL